MKKKRKKRFLLLLVDIFAWNILNLLYKTIKFEFDNKKVIDENKQYILSLFHRHLLIPLYVLKNRDIYVLVSDHTDGEIIARIIDKTGNKTARGSSTRGFIKGIKQLINISKTNNLAITPDGPNGPIYTIQDGLLFLAKKTNYPIIGISGNFNKKIVFNSWDNFILPLPFSKCYVNFSDPIYYNNKLNFKENKVHLEKLLIKLADASSTYFKLNNKKTKWTKFANKYKLTFWFLSKIYNYIISLKNLLYKCNIIKKEKFSNIRIISFGNITVGGTGKTQILEHYASNAEDKTKIIILTGGYKSKCSSFTIVNTNTKPKYSGDEALMLKKNIPYATVVASNNKKKAIKIINRNFKEQTLFIDDAYHYQHIDYKINNNQNILVIDGTTNIFTEKLIPAGKLREPVKAISRATTVIINKSEFINTNKYNELINNIIKINKSVKILKTEYKIEKIYNLLDKNNSIDNINKFTFNVFTGIGNPDFFIDLLNKKGFKINKKLLLNDHADYNIDEVAYIKKLFNSADYLLTTEKDAVKLKDHSYLDKNKIFVVKTKLKFLQC